MTELALFAPANLIVPPEHRGAKVDGDMYMICERIAEISDRLQIIPTNRSDYPFAVSENCADGTERLVCKVRELDGRVLEHLRRLMSMPLQERIAEIEKAHHKFEQDAREEESERFYEEVGRPMLSQLDHDGFIDRPVSYPKAGVATKGRTRR